jgi:hypothetical protein
MHVQEQVLRRHYGAIIWRPFQFGDPAELHHRDLDGEVICTNAFQWYAQWLSSSYDFSYISRTSPFRTATRWRSLWNSCAISLSGIKQRLIHTSTISGFRRHPKLPNTIGKFLVMHPTGSFVYSLGVKKIVTLKVNLKTLPPSTVSKLVNAQAQPYCQVNFMLKIRFLTTLEFTIVCQGKVYGSVVSEYS